MDKIIANSLRVTAQWYSPIGVYQRAMTLPIGS
jgi:hypothetical protein